MPVLTPRERETLTLLACGMEPKAVACAMGIRRRTVWLYVRRARMKFNAPNLTAIIALTVSLEMIEVPKPDDCREIDY